MKESRALEQHIHFWLGSEVSNDEGEQFIDTVIKGESENGK